MAALDSSKQEGRNLGALHNWVKRFQQGGSGLLKPTMVDK